MRGGPRLERGNDVGSIVAGVYFFTFLFFKVIGEYSIILTALIQTLLIFCCLAGTTLIREVRMVFEAVDRSLDEGRKQVARIVGRDTSAPICTRGAYRSFGDFSRKSE